MNNLKKIRGQKCITAKELCRRIGVSRQLLSYYENNHTKLSKKIALRCANELGVSVFEILGKDVFTILPSTEEDKAIVLAELQKLGE